MSFWWVPICFQVTLISNSSMSWPSPCLDWNSPAQHPGGLPACGRQEGADVVVSCLAIVTPSIASTCCILNRFTKTMNHETNWNETPEETWVVYISNRFPICFLTQPWYIYNRIIYIYTSQPTKGLLPVSGVFFRCFQYVSTALRNMNLIHPISVHHVEHWPWKLIYHP